MSTGTTSSRAGAATVGPLFGVEFEFFLKIKQNAAKSIEQSKSQGERLPPHYQKWDFKLPNNAGPDETNSQRWRVHNAVRQILEELGLSDGWNVADDESLDEKALSDRFYWRCEVITRPMYASESWMAEIHKFFSALSGVFDIWVNGDCSCHVHITPGTARQAPYYTPQELAQVACGTCYWEAPLEALLPPQRKRNDWAKRNTDEIPELRALYNAVSRDSWDPVFKRFLNAAKTGKLPAVAALMWGDIRRIKKRDGTIRIRYWDKYMSTNYANVLSTLGTVEFRRQGGVKTSDLAIHQILLALTLHVSALRTNWATKSKLKAHPTAQELVQELVRTMSSLPQASHSNTFEKWLGDCYHSYAKQAPGALSKAEKEKINKVQQKNKKKPSSFAISASPSPPPMELAPAPWVGPMDESELTTNPWA